MSEWIAEHITEPLQEMVIDSFNAVLITILNGLVNLITGVFQHELELAKSLLENEYVTSAVTYSIAIALLLLGVRVAFDAFKTYIAYSTGEESHPGELIKNAVVSTAMIVSIPWITKQVLYFSFSILDDIQLIQAVPNVENLGQVIIGMVTAGMLMSLVISIMFIISLVIGLVILIQIAVRAVNIAILMVIGPWMWAFKNELGGAWFKALLQQCFAIPIQIFMLRGAFGSLLSTTTQGPLAILLFLGFLWATLKFPAFLQQLVAQTGVGSAVGGTAKSIGAAVAIRRLAGR